MEHMSTSELPLVTIGLPVYNGMPTIGEALETLLLQDYPNLQIIISDNASTDGTLEACQALTRQDSRVRIISKKVNEGAVANFRAVLDAADGEFFMWAAADDYWSPQFVSRLLPALRADAAIGVAMCAVDRRLPDGTPFDLIRFRGDMNPNGMGHLRLLGFAAACNKGVRVASSEFLLFLNPDCSFEPGTLVELMDAISDDDRVGMVGGLLVNTDGSEQAGCRRAVPTPWRSFVRAFGLSRFAHRWPRLFYDFQLHTQPLPKFPVEVEAISGACMLVKREALEVVGFWDEGYFLHCEDLDLCMRFRQKGWEILFVPSAIIVHHLGVCSSSRPVFVEWHKHKGMIRFYRKFFRHQYPGVLMWLVTIGVWCRFGLVAVYHTLRRDVKSFGVNRAQ